jgi:hypothetical protein
MRLSALAEASDLTPSQLQTALNQLDYQGKLIPSTPGTGHARIYQLKQEG